MGNISQVGGMYGPFPLNAATITSVVHVPMGYYVLADTNGAILRVGRSDDNAQGLAGRLRNYVADKAFDACKQFRFKEADSLTTAFAMECHLYHSHMPSLNMEHPKIPAGQNWKCPATGCTHPN